MRMKIETKFNIGDRVWIVYENRGEVNVYSDEIDSMTIENGGRLLIWFKDSDAMDVYEEDLIRYEDLKTLSERVLEIDNKIRKEQCEKNEDN